MRLTISAEAVDATISKTRPIANQAARRMANRADRASKHLPWYGPKQTSETVAL